MLNKIFTPLILLFILIIGLFLRLYKIDSIPPHLSNDEISIAYDAFSINKTQKDEYGIHLPLSFKSQGSYKAPGYAYLLSPLFNFLPNTDLTARLPSIIMGLITLLSIGLISFYLSGSKIIGLTSAALLSITPWHIFTSRSVFEANIALTFYSLGLLFFIINFYQKKYNLFYFFLSAIFFIASIYSYHSQWLYVPLTIIFLLFLLNKQNKVKFFYLSLCILLITPLIFDSIKNQDTTARQNTQLVWQESMVAQEINNTNSVFKKIKIVNRAITNNYLSQIKPSFLFFEGLGLFKKNFPLEMGLFLYPFIIPFTLGLINLPQNINKKSQKIIYFLLITSPFIPAITHGSNILRNLIFIIPSIIIISFGFVKILKSNFFIKISFLGFLLMSIFYFYTMYFYQSPREIADTYQGYKPIAHYLQSIEYQHAHIHYRFGPECRFIGVPHYYFGFYNYIDPKFFHNRISDSNGTHYGNFSIQHIDWNNIDIKQNHLYITPASNKITEKVKDKVKLEKEFFDPNGYLSFQIWKGI